MVRYQRLDSVGGAAVASRFGRLLILLIFIAIIALIFYLHTSNNDIFRETPLEPKLESTFSKVIATMRFDLQQKVREIEQLQMDLDDAHKKVVPPPKYRRRLETANVDCKRLFDNDKGYMRELGKSRIQMMDNNGLDMSCDGIRARVVGDLKIDSLKFGVAFARIVYSDYEMLEDMVRHSYHPQNVFCFAIDKKADSSFHRRMRSLASCLPNVLLLPDEDQVDGSGHNVNKAHYSCMNALVNKPGWGYIVLLQNHDVISKSVFELVQIFDIFGGANDVELTPDAGRANKSLNWDAKSLKLFRNETAAKPSQLSATMKFAKGAAQASFSREAVDWMVRTADLTTFIAQMNSGSFGVDEQMAESFQITENLEMPGHFTDECLKKGKVGDFVTRMSQWMYSHHEKCGSNTTRHAICMLGVEDLPTIAQFPNIMVNKMMPSFDYAAVDCLGELLYNRTYLRQNDHPLEINYYANMVNVLYHKHHNEPGYTLNCTPSYTPWQLRKYPV